MVREFVNNLSLANIDVISIKTCIICNEQIEKKKTLNFFIMITKMYLCLCVPTESIKIKPSQILVIPHHIASVFRLEVVTQTKKIQTTN